MKKLLIALCLITLTGCYTKEDVNKLGCTDFRNQTVYIKYKQGWSLNTQAVCVINEVKAKL